MNWFSCDNHGLLFWVKVQPKSCRDEFAGLLGDALKIRITAPPVDGKANKHLKAWLACQFDVAKSSVILEHGQAQRRRLVRIVSRAEYRQNSPAWAFQANRLLHL